MKRMLVVTLPPFSPCRVGEGKRAAISKQTWFTQKRVRSCIVFALGTEKVQTRQKMSKLDHFTVENVTNVSASWKLRGSNNFITFACVNHATYCEAGSMMIFSTVHSNVTAVALDCFYLCWRVDKFFEVLVNKVNPNFQEFIIKEE